LETCGNSYHKSKTEKKLAEEYKVSPKTIRNKVTDIAGDDTRKAVLGGIEK